MKQLTYDGGTWLLGDDAADALLNYAVALGRRAAADSIELSVIDPDGHPERLTLLIGPATMMSAGTSRSQADEPDNREVVEEMRKRSRAAAPPAPARPSRSDAVDYIEDF